MAELTIRQAKTLVKKLYRLQIQTGIRYCVELVSGPGMGKSEMIDQTAIELGEEMKIPFACLSFFLNSKEAPDIGGYGLPDEDADGEKIMVWTRAPWMPRAGDPTHGFIFLDEFRQSQHDVQKPSAELLLKGRVNSSQLPITYMVLAASNRESDRSGVARELAFVTNRKIEIEIKPDLNSWVSWAERNGVHWLAIAFAKHRPGLIFQDKVPEKPGPFCSPRSFTKTATLIEPFAEEEELFLASASGLMGEGAATEFIAFTRVVDVIPTYEEIVKDPTGAKLPPQERPDALYAVMQLVGHRADAETAMPAFKYLKRLPEEFQVAGLQATLRRSPHVLQNEDFAKWCRDNAELVKRANFMM